MFATSFAFYAISFAPIEVLTCSAPQNDRQSLVCVKNIKVVVEKMTRNRRKMIEQMGDSLLLSKNSIQLSALSLVVTEKFLMTKLFCPHRKPTRSSIISL